MLDYRKCEQMYREDPAFNHLVTCLEMALDTCQLTPADLRAAAMFAATRHQMRHPPEIIYVPGDLPRKVTKP